MSRELNPELTGTKELEFIVSLDPNFAKQPEVRRTLNASYKAREKLRDLEKDPFEKSEKMDSIGIRTSRAFMEKRSRQLQFFQKITEKNGSDLYIRNSSDKRLRRLLIEPFVVSTEGNNFEKTAQSYLRLEQRIAFDMGLGNNNLTYKDLPQEEQDLVREAVVTKKMDQETRLVSWLNYLASSNAPYPIWFKYLAYTEITRLKEYDRATNNFSTRDKTTLDNFPELNEEALSITFQQILDRHINEPTSPNVRTEQKKGASLFAGIYAEECRKIIDKDNNVTNKEREITNGIWIKYDQGADPSKLAESLAGKNTGWCTAGVYTAGQQLKGGDFYVYYSYSSSGKPDIPRIAIRMQDNEVAEVRGTGNGQELEENMLDIAYEKTLQLPGGERFLNAFQDMKKVKSIYARFKQSPTDYRINVQEAIFLYELERPIVSFSYRRDPRVSEILNLRNDTQDMLAIAEYSHTKDKAKSGAIRNLIPELFTKGTPEIKRRIKEVTLQGNLVEFAPLIFQHFMEKERYTALDTPFYKNLWEVITKNPDARLVAEYFTCLWRNFHPRNTVLPGFQDKYDQIMDLVLGNSRKPELEVPLLQYYWYPTNVEKSRRKELDKRAEEVIKYGDKHVLANFVSTHGEPKERQHNLRDEALNTLHTYGGTVEATNIVNYGGYFLEENIGFVLEQGDDHTALALADTRALARSAITERVWVFLEQSTDRPAIARKLLAASIDWTFDNDDVWDGHWYGFANDRIDDMFHRYLRNYGDEEVLKDIEEILNGQMHISIWEPLREKLEETYTILLRKLGPQSNATTM